MLVGAARLLLAGFGAFLFLGGVLAATSGAGPVAVPLIVAGGALILIPLFERTRYRSQAAERGGQQIGPGGGETEALPARFERTDERFVDPTSGRLMTVYVDRRTGERRYRADA